MRLLLDEDSQARRLIDMLRQQGHDLFTIADLDCRGLSDAGVLARAATERRVLLTRNCADFLALHRRDADHAGILCVYQSADPAKCMRYADIAKALGNLQDTGTPLEGQFIALNAWLY